MNAINVLLFLIKRVFPLIVQATHSPANSRVFICYALALPATGARRLLISHQLLYTWPIHTAIPPCMHSFAIGNNIPIAVCKERRDLRDVIDIYQRKLIASHVLMLAQETVSNVKKRLERLYCLRYNSFISIQAPKWFGKFLKCDSACGLGKVERLCGLCLVK